MAHLPDPGLVFRAGNKLATLVTGEQPETVGSRFKEMSPKTISMWQTSLRRDVIALLIREMPIDAIMSYHYTLTRMGRDQGDCSHHILAKCK